jgi:hypothetical protein
VTWEWLAPTAALAGALIGAIATWLVARGHRLHAEKMLLYSEETTRKAARGPARRQCYAELMRFVERTGIDIAKNIFPAPASRVEASAIASTDASASVNRLLREYLEIVVEINEMDGLVQKWNEDATISRWAITFQSR